MADVQAPQKFTISLGGAKKSAPSANPLKRPRASLLEDDDDEGHVKKVQAVTHFDLKAGGAIDENKPKDRGPLVIKPLANRDWKEAGRQRRQQNAVPQTEDQDARIASIEAAEKREKDRSYGLNVMKSAAKEADAEEVIEETAPEETESEVAQEKTADERAMDALLGVEQESTLVVPAVTEGDAFQSDFRSAPAGPTLDDYARVPVEEFGAAMLRGMGWKGGKTKVVKAPERRPALLGIGAKGDAAMTAELGGWGKAARGKEPIIYNPVLLKDKKTGELFTEAEMQKRKEQDQRRAYEDELEAEQDKRRRRRHEEEGTKDRRHGKDRRGARSRDRYDRHKSGRDRSEERRDRRYDSGRDRSRERRRHESGRDRSRNEHSRRDRSRDRRRHESDRDSHRSRRDH